jgi:hypothetical protein
VRRSKLLLAAAATAIACASGAACAARVGVVVGVGGPWYYPVVPAPYYYGPAPVVVAPPADAPDYVEQGQAQAGPAGPYQPGQQYQQGPAAGPGAQADNGDTWYYCDASRTYYPYVKQCSSGWRAVPAQPAQ